MLLMNINIQGTPCRPVEPFRFPLPGGKQDFTLRSLDILNDIATILEWTRMEYARKFWLMDLPEDGLIHAYNRVMEADDEHSYLGLLDYRPVCQLDVYRVPGTEISRHYRAGQGDYGIHLLMGPDRRKFPDLTVRVIRASLYYLFSYPQVDRVIGEPDILNRAANLVIRRAGFRFCQQVQLSDKTANLYQICRSEFRNIPVGENDETGDL